MSLKEKENNRIMYFLKISTVYEKNVIDLFFSHNKSKIDKEITDLTLFVQRIRSIGNVDVYKSKIGAPFPG